MGDQLIKLPSESMTDFSIRICENKETYGITWDQIADILNAASGKDYGESKWRKWYKGFNAGREHERKHNMNDMLIAQSRELEKQRIRLADERAALKRIIRDEARRDAWVDDIKSVIEKVATPYPTYDIAFDDCGAGMGTMVVCLSDLHIGIQFNNAMGKYDTTIAWERLNKYAHKVVEAARLYKPKKIIVACLGDLVSGIQHIGIRVENRESMTEQIKVAAEFVAWFVNTVSYATEEVELYGVSGNHSRVSDYDSLRVDEMMDALIPWYVEAKLSDNKKVHIVDSENALGFEHCYVGKAHMVFVHGDLDSFDERGIAKLQTMTGEVDYLLCGHMHHTQYKDILGTVCVMSGTLADSADQYCIKNRLHGNPSQAMMVLGENGELEAFIPVYF